MTLEEKQARIEVLSKQISDLTDEKTRLYQEVVEERAPIKVGEWLEWNAGSKRRRGLVRAIVGGGSNRTGGVQRYIVNPILKGGKIGAKVDVYTWEMSQIEKVNP